MSSFNSSSNSGAASISVVAAAADANYDCLNEKDDQYTFRYEPREMSDVQVDVPMVDKEGNETGVVYHFHVHRIVLSSQCLWFRTVFSADPTCTHLTMPTSFVYHYFGKGYYVLATLEQIHALFDTVYMIPTRHWWCLSISSRRSLVCPCEGTLNGYALIQACFYVGHTGLLDEIETHLTTCHLSDGRYYTLFAVMMAAHYKMSKWEDAIFTQIKKQQFIDIKDLIREGIRPLLNIKQLHRFLLVIHDKLSTLQVSTCT